MGFFLKGKDSSFTDSKYESEITPELYVKRVYLLSAPSKLSGTVWTFLKQEKSGMNELTSNLQSNDMMSCLHGGSVNSQRKHFWQQSCNYSPVSDIWLSAVMSCKFTVCFLPLMYPGAAALPRVHFHENMTSPLRQQNSQMSFELGSKGMGVPHSTMSQTMLVQASLCELCISFPEAEIELKSLESVGGRNVSDNSVFSVTCWC